MVFEISSDKKRLDIDMIQGFLTRSYWCAGRTKEEVMLTIEHSICFGVYFGNKQIGFARVLTDGVAFAYLLDVFIINEFR